MLNINASVNQFYFLRLNAHHIERFYIFRVIAYFLFKDRSNFDVTMGRLQNQCYFQGVYRMYCNSTNCVK